MLTIIQVDEYVKEPLNAMQDVIDKPFFFFSEENTYRLHSTTPLSLRLDKLLHMKNRSNVISSSRLTSEAL